MDNTEKTTLATKKTELQNEQQKLEKRVADLKTNANKLNPKKFTKEQKSLELDLKFQPFERLGGWWRYTPQNYEALQQLNDDITKQREPLNQEFKNIKNPYLDNTGKIDPKQKTENKHSKISPPVQEIEMQSKQTPPSASNKTTFVPGQHSPDVYADYLKGGKEANEPLINSSHRPKGTENPTQALLFQDKNQADTFFTKQASMKREFGYSVGGTASDPDNKYRPQVMGFNDGTLYKGNLDNILTQVKGEQASLNKEYKMNKIKFLMGNDYEPTKKKDESGVNIPVASNDKENKLEPSIPISTSKEQQKQESSTNKSPSEIELQPMTSPKSANAILTETASKSKTPLSKPTENKLGGGSNKFGI